MWQKMKRRPQLAIVAAGGIVVLIVAILAPTIGAQVHARLQAPSTANGARAPLATSTLPRTNLPISPHVHTVWGDSTVLVAWDAIAGVSGYRATLIRVSDMGIMEQIALPGSQTMWDAQGIWPGNAYFVAIQPVRASGEVGSPMFSAVGRAVPISYTTYNGFLDTENRPAGQIDTNLWDEHIFLSNVEMYGDTFVNGQMHYHLQAGCPPSAPCAGQQTITVQNARVPIDWTNRTATIHGEVDLKGDFHQWFGAVLSPQIVGADRVLDEVDRFLIPVTMPQLEIFTFEGNTNLLYAAGDGSEPRVLASIPNPRGINNVRDEIVWRVSKTHTTIVIDGKTAFDLDWPAPLAFTHGYLSLFAEDYPNSGGVTQGSCDRSPTGDCSVWHIDNWGFDAPAGHVQPTSRAYYAQGCGPYAGTQDQEIQAGTCGDQKVAPSGSAVSWQVPGVDTNQVVEAHVVFDARLWDNGPLSVSVNGHAAVAVPYIASDRNVGNTQSYLVAVPASDLVRGTNTVSMRLGNNNLGAVDIYNVQIETLSSVPYTPPPLPPEPAPIAYLH